MSRVNLDVGVWNDPRVKRLNKMLGWKIPHTVGTLAAVWAVAYEAKDPCMAAIDIDTAAEHDGFAELMQHPQVQLARCNGDGRLYLAGVTERIGYLLTQAERGRLGGLKRAASADRSPDGRMANAKQTPSTGQASAKQPPSLPLPLPPDLPPDLDLPPDPKNVGNVGGKPPSVRGKGKHKPTETELASVRVVLEKLGNFSGVSYRGSDKHTALIVGRLRGGATEWDLRRVIGYCAIKLGWQDPAHKLHHCLRPETLFGPETIEKYLDPARAWEPSPEPPEARPQLRLVTEPPSSEITNNTEDMEDERWTEPEWMTSG